MEIGADVEVKRGEEWSPAVIIDRFTSPIDVSGALVTVKFHDGTVKEYSVPDDITQTIPDIRIIPKNIDALDVDDLTALIELDEMSILSALECRFKKQNIYTNTGSILLAVNPFDKIEGLYGHPTLNQYIQKFDGGTASNRGSGTASGTTSRRRGSTTASCYNPNEPLPPHIYQVAGEAYKAMLNAPTARTSKGLNSSDQSILVSGESGSGKTESTKFLMEYLAQVGDNSADQTSIAAKVLQTNILLESFGNARTLRNDNSSRFGKFIKLHFTTTGKLTEASIQTYLLEKVRLVSQSKGERNYHIFYEMCTGASSVERTRWQLDPPKDRQPIMEAGDMGGDITEEQRQFLHYRLLNQSQCFQRRDGVQDKIMYQCVKDAMKVIGFTQFEQEGAFDVLAALLHIGNLSFEHDEHAATGSSTSSTDANGNVSDLGPHCIWSRNAAAKLLAVEPIQLEKALSVRQIRAGTDYVSVKLSAEQANNARDALAKALYGRLFDWMVMRMNAFLKNDANSNTANSKCTVGQKASSAFIGILDIFGFEVFPKNSFEQLCINFANETLQQQFNEYVFKMEQQEYEAQGVEWKYIEFIDNEDCVNLISQRPMGILPLIDEECLIPRGSDNGFASKLYRACEQHPRFAASRIQKAGGNFTILHYAGQVEYSSTGFLEKNKDQLHQEAVNLLVYSTIEQSFTRQLCEGSFSRPVSRSVSSRGHGRNRSSTSGSCSGFSGASVGLQFREQLTDLLETLCQTSPHYVRCLKPNDQSEAHTYVRDRVLHQLRCNGVMEAVRVARAGYPIRMPHDEFVNRYYALKCTDNPLAHLKHTRLSHTERRISKSRRKRTSSASLRLSSSDAAIVHESKELLKDLLEMLPKGLEGSSNGTTSRSASMTGDSQTTFEHSDQAQFAAQSIACGIQFGISKMFLKRSAYDVLEDLIYNRVNRQMSIVYHAVLFIHARWRYLRFKHAVRTIQLLYRFKLRKRAIIKRKALAFKMRTVKKIQAFFQMVVLRKKFLRFRYSVQLMQCRYRFKKMIIKETQMKGKAASLAAAAAAKLAMPPQVITKVSTATADTDSDSPAMSPSRISQRLSQTRLSVQRVSQTMIQFPTPFQHDAQLTQMHRASQIASEMEADLPDMATSILIDTGVEHTVSVPLLTTSYTAPDSLSSLDNDGDEEIKLLDTSMEVPDELEIDLESIEPVGGPVPSEMSSSTQESEDFFPTFNDGVATAAPGTRKSMKSLDERKLNATLGRASTGVLNPNSRSSSVVKGQVRSMPPAPATGPMFDSGSSRTSSFRATRSSRAVNLPRLDVVQQTQWVNDEDRFSCHICNKRFNMFKRKHHCRACGEVICNSCSLYHRIQSRSMRVCVSCVAFHSLDSPSSKASSAVSTMSSTQPRNTSNDSSNYELSRQDAANILGFWQNPWPEPPYPDDEEDRLAVLKEFNIRELATSGKFNMYCEVAAKTMKCPIAYVSIIEDEEQILIASIGMTHTTLPREMSFCAHTICSPNVLVVLDTKMDDRFRENPMVKGEGKGAIKIRYYAGATIFSKDGHALGTVAVFDTKPRREADQEHIGMLQHLSFLASEKMSQTIVQSDNSDTEFMQ